MYTLRQIGINIYQKTDLRQPYGRDASRSAHRVQYIAGGLGVAPSVVFIRIIIHHGCMISERDKSRPFYGWRVDFYGKAERDKSRPYAIRVVF